LNYGSLNPATRQLIPALQHLTTIATPCQFGQEIDGNTRRGPNISPAQHNIIIGEQQCGVTIKELAAEFGHSKSAIKYTI
jgi:hypothetical protein